MAQLETTAVQPAPSAFKAPAVPGNNNTAENSGTNFVKVDFKDRTITSVTPMNTARGVVGATTTREEFLRSAGPVSDISYEEVLKRFNADATRSFLQNLKFDQTTTLTDRYRDALIDRAKELQFPASYIAVINSKLPETQKVPDAVQADVTKNIPRERSAVFQQLNSIGLGALYDFTRARIVVDTLTDKYRNEPNNPALVEAKKTYEVALTEANKGQNLAILKGATFGVEAKAIEKALHESNQVLDPLFVARMAEHKLTPNDLNELATLAKSENSHRVIGGLLASMYSARNPNTMVKTSTEFADNVLAGLKDLRDPHDKNNNLHNVTTISDLNKKTDIPGNYFIYAKLLEKEIANPNSTPDSIRNVMEKVTMVHTIEPRSSADLAFYMKPGAESEAIMSVMRGEKVNGVKVPVQRPETLEISTPQLQTAYTAKLRIAQLDTRANQLNEDDGLKHARSIARAYAEAGARGDTLDHVSISKTGGVRNAQEKGIALVAYNAGLHFKDSTNGVELAEQHTQYAMTIPNHLSVREREEFARPKIETSHPGWQVGIHFTLWRFERDRLPQDPVRAEIESKYPKGDDWNKLISDARIITYGAEHVAKQDIARERSQQIYDERQEEIRRVESRRDIRRIRNGTGNPFR